MYAVTAQPSVESAAFAYKPSPEALLHICSVWGIAGEEAVFVGDSAKDDVRVGLIGLITQPSLLTAEPGSPMK